MVDFSKVTVSNALEAATVLLSVVMPSFLFGQVQGYTATVVAGQLLTPNSGPALNTTLGYPLGITLDASGSLYLADGSRGVVYKVTSGNILALAGGGTSSLVPFLGDGGPATGALLSAPRGVAIDAGGNLYIADTGNNRIRKVTNGIITTIVGPGSTNGALGDGGPATAATLSAPSGIALDQTGNLYIADTQHNSIRKISSGLITTIAGNYSGKTVLGDGGPATNAGLLQPSAVAVDAAGNVYIADSGHNRIRKVSPSGIITTAAGNGSAGYSGDGGLAALAALSLSNGFYSNYSSQGLVSDSTGNLYIADLGNNRIRVVSSDGKINSIAGIGTPAFDVSAPDVGPANTVQLYTPLSIAVGNMGQVYFSEIGKNYYQSDVKMLTPSATQVFPLSTEAAAYSASDFGNFNQLALGSLASIYGSYLSSTSRSWTGTDFIGANAPTSLDGTSVSIGGQPAFVNYVSPGQLNVQVPTTIGTGMQPLIIKTPNGTSATYSVTVNSIQPGLLAPPSFAVGSTQYVVAIYPDGATYALPTNAIPGIPSRPAKAGDTIVLYGIGFGFVSPSSPAGQLVQTANSLTLPLVVKIGSTVATVAYAGLAPGEVGLYQFNVIVPKLTSTGNLSLTFTLGGVNGTQSLYLSTQ